MGLGRHQEVGPAFSPASKFLGSPMCSRLGDSDPSSFGEKRFRWGGFFPTALKCHEVSGQEGKGLSSRPWAGKPSSLNVAPKVIGWRDAACPPSPAPSRSSCRQKMQGSAGQEPAPGQTPVGLTSQRTPTRS